MKKQPHTRKRRSVEKQPRVKKQSIRSKLEDAVTIISQTEEFQSPVGENAVVILRQVLRSFARYINEERVAGNDVLELGWTYESLPMQVASLTLLHPFLTSHIYVSPKPDNEYRISVRFRIHEYVIFGAAQKVAQQEKALQDEEELHRFKRLLED